MAPVEIPTSCDSIARFVVQPVCISRSPGDSRGPSPIVGRISRSLYPNATATADVGFPCAEQGRFWCPSTIQCVLRDVSASLYLTQGIDPAGRGGCALGAGVDASVAELDELCFGDAGVLDCGAVVRDAGGARRWATWT